MVQTRDINRLIEALEEGAVQRDFRAMLSGCRDLLQAHGVLPDRIQIPMIKPLGFRHPTIWGVILTWHRDRAFSDTMVMTHDEAKARGALDEEQPPDSDGRPTTPYHYVYGQRDWMFECETSSPPIDLPIFDNLREDGLKYYACFRLHMPAVNRPAVVSLSAETPFPNDLRERLEPLRGLLGMAWYAAYRTSQALQIARSYVGPTTGPKVLDGQIVRGSSETIDAGVMFCDVRGFTALSQTVGSEIIPIMNRLFEVIGDEANQRGGEILKFIGDAMLLIFPLDGRTQIDVARCLIETVEQSLHRVKDVALDMGYELACGFGCHIGEVIYGNIGTSQRLDFTVMGPAVNLASRLESCCKEFDADAIFSTSVKAHAPHLVKVGEKTLKGIEGSTPLWVLPN
ncbi:MAG: adenylate/guanylate cyclase domain-containing protein [Myxococcota bacterium]|nr:adenylate/guanylate cyclase domain-containing protein [Myxococcota bacterium]